MVPQGRGGEEKGNLLGVCRGPDIVHGSGNGFESSEVLFRVSVCNGVSRTGTVRGMLYGKSNCLSNYSLHIPSSTVSMPSPDPRTLPFRVVSPVTVHPTRVGRPGGMVGPGVVVDEGIRLPDSVVLVRERSLGRDTGTYRHPP